MPVTWKRNRSQPARTGLTPRATSMLGSQVTIR